MINMLRTLKRQEHASVDGNVSRGTEVLRVQEMLEIKNNAT